MLPVLLLSVVLHEVAHGWVALRQGDPTAALQGRLTLNPLAHVDPVGSVLVPLLLWLAPGGVLFGWARPVPVDPRNFRHPRRGDILVSLAGVTANLALAVACTALAALALQAALAGPAAGRTLELVGRAALAGVWINLTLFFFNLLPIPPLDGSHVVAQLLPPRLAAAYRSFGRYGILALLALLVLAPGSLRVLLAPVSFFGRLAEALVWGSP